MLLHAYLAWLLVAALHISAFFRESHQNSLNAEYRCDYGYALLNSHIVMLSSIGIKRALTHGILFSGK